MAGSLFILLGGAVLERPSFISHYTFTGFYDFEKEVTDFSKSVSKQYTMCVYVYECECIFSSKVNKQKPVLGVYFGT